MKIDKTTESKILAAATEEFLERGYSGARMQQIAIRAEINKALLHYYFRSKEKLFNTVFDELFVKLMEQFGELFSLRISAEEKIRIFFDRHISFLQQNPRLPIFILNEIQKNPEVLSRSLKNAPIHLIWSSAATINEDSPSTGKMANEDMIQLLASMIAISVFPFATREILSRLIPEESFDFDNFIEERKVWAANFVISGINGIGKKNI